MGSISASFKMVSGLAKHLQPGAGFPAKKITPAIRFGDTDTDGFYKTAVELSPHVTQHLADLAASENPAMRHAVSDVLQSLTEADSFLPGLEPHVVRLESLDFAHILHTHENSPLSDAEKKSLTTVVGEIRDVLTTGEYDDKTELINAAQDILDSMPEKQPDTTRYLLG